MKVALFQQIWRTQQWPQDWKRSVFIPIPKKGNAKECSNYCTIALISHTSKVMLKILQARLQQNMNHLLPDVQAGFSKGRGTRDQTANIRWIIEKASEFQKNIYFCFIDFAKAFDCVDHNKLWKILEETPWTVARQASLSITNSWNLFKLMSIKSVTPDNHLIRYCPLLLPPSIFPSIRSFPMSHFFASGGQSIGVSASASVLSMNIQD